ncbi:MAG: class I SAM-dependent methyltransferase [Lachnospiraceae bacterium]|nr:class I SAM-dependent methyltransferase [Lachnospiraceae bacterium]
MSELKMDKTIDYYNQNADAFASGTINVEFTDVQDKFLSYLPFDAYILDFGCGSGRDTKYFLSKGFHVDATVYSVRYQLGHKCLLTRSKLTRW